MLSLLLLLIVSKLKKISQIKLILSMKVNYINLNYMFINS